MTQTRCHHCDDVVPDGVALTATIGGQEKPVCCIGCAAAAEFIEGAGLAGFYKQREVTDAARLKPAAGPYADFDKTDVAHPFVRACGDSRAEATVYVGDLYCPACVWLVSEILENEAGVESVSANPASRRVSLRWQADVVGLGTLLERLAAVGFKPEPVLPGQTTTAERDDYRAAVRRLVVASVFGMQAMMLAVGLYAGEFQGMTESMGDLLRIASLMVSLPVVGYAALPFYRGAWRGLSAGRPGMDVPVTLAIGVAFAASILGTTTGGDVYYDSVSMFVALLSITRFLEMRARHRSDDRSQAMAAMLPAAATRLDADGSDQQVARAVIRSHDRLRVRSGDVIAADGSVESGTLAIDESLMTGESNAVARSAGEPVTAGSRVTAGEAIISVTRTGASTRLAEIAALVERAQADRGDLQGVADRWASTFVVMVLALAVVAAIVWWPLAPQRALPIVLSVLIVACPCALSLATPTALTSAAARLSRAGVLLVRSRLLQALRPDSVVVFDKTGTLTRGTPSITGFQTLGDMPEATCRRIAAALEEGSEHVLAHAFTAERDPRTKLDDAPDVTLGAGIEGRLFGVRYRIGHRAFVCEIAGDNVATRAGIVEDGVFLAREGQLLARFEISDPLRDDAADTIARLRKLGLQVAIASGDRLGAVAKAAAAVGVNDFHAGLTPADKLAFVHRLKSDGKNVVMLGDGVNDAPVLAAADASIAIGRGAALARASADAILLGSKLAPLITLVEVARQTRRTIAQSLLWAAGYNLVGVTVAMTGLIAPWMAAIGMSASSLIVVGNALRLNRTRSKRRQVAESLQEAVA